MGLVPNTRLGFYRIVSPIGSGGMGEVYQARDTRLDRIVAVKVITSGSAVNPELRTRFEREARAISSLNHPNICVLHDIGREHPVPPQSDGSGDSRSSSTEDAAVDFLVMEYLEGETLAGRLARGASRTAQAPSMTVDQAVAVAIQIASALDGAHRAGIVHRDLKPGNVMLTKAASANAPGVVPASSIRVKLMDFGLARLTAAGGERNSDRGNQMVSLAELSMPTASAPLTRQGSILGTLHYMSPEQLEGKDVDARTDIFAFGVVLYEMLSGRRPFEGKSQASVIGAILEQDPAPVTSLQPLTPPMLADLVARCLAKDPDERWQSARDLMRQLEAIATWHGVTAVSAQAPSAGVRRRTRLLGMSAAFVTGVAIAASSVGWLLRPAATPSPVVSRFTFNLPDGQLLGRGGQHVVALSRDGTRMVYVANQQLYLRNMHELKIQPVVGTEGSDPTEPIFSPDGEWVAYWSEGALKKIPVGGGTPVVLAAAENPLGASWEEDGRILLGQLTPRGIVEIPENGGTAKLLVTLDMGTGEEGRSPQLVAGGRSVLLTLRAGKDEWHESSIVVQDLATGRRNVVLRGGTDARVLPTGHLVYAKSTAMFAAAFDETRLMVTGDSVPVQDDAFLAPGTGATQVAWSDSGTFVIVHGMQTFRSTVDFVSRRSQRERTILPVRNYGVRASELRLSPDGTRIAATIFSDDVLRSGTTGSEIYVGDLERGSLIRLSFTGAASSPVWTPDGERVCYDTGREVHCQPADGRGAAGGSLKVEGLVNTRPFLPDGRMVLETRGPSTGNDIAVTTVTPSVETRPLLNTTHSETAPAISPDGRWLAYVSDESGRAEVYVRPFPAVEKGLWPISTGGGAEPRWAPNGRELFYTVRTAWDRPGVLMSVPVQSGSAFIAGRPVEVLKLRAGMSEAYDVTRDGRFVFNVQTSLSGAEVPQEIVVVQNWFEELKARVPTRAAQ
jgi:serine/threonine-protein kinase